MQFLISRGVGQATLMFRLISPNLQSQSNIGWNVSFNSAKGFTLAKKDNGSLMKTLFAPVKIGQRLPLSSTSFKLLLALPLTVEPSIYTHGSQLNRPTLQCKPRKVTKSYSGRGILVRFLYKCWDLIRFLLSLTKFIFLFSPFLFFYPLGYISVNIEDVWWIGFKKAIELGGPITVELAKWLGTREDLFLHKTCLNLLSVTHRDRPHSWYSTKKKLRRALGRDWSNIVVKFEPKRETIATSEIAQVYKAQLPFDACSDQVAEEIIRDVDDSEGLEEPFLSDGIEIVGLGRWMSSHDDDDIVDSTFGSLMLTKQGTWNNEDSAHVRACPIVLPDTSEECSLVDDQPKTKPRFSERLQEWKYNTVSLVMERCYQGFGKCYKMFETSYNIMAKIGVLRQELQIVPDPFDLTPAVQPKIETELRADEDIENKLFFEELLIDNEEHGECDDCQVNCQILVQMQKNDNSNKDKDSKLNMEDIETSEHTKELKEQIPNLTPEELAIEKVTVISEETQPHIPESLSEGVEALLQIGAEAVKKAKDGVKEGVVQVKDVVIPTNEEQDIQMVQTEVEDEAVLLKFHPSECECQLCQNLVPVAIKVLHPGIVRRATRELSVIRLLAGFVQTCFPPLWWIEPVNCIDEFADRLHRLINLKREAIALERFNINFNLNPNIRFPRPMRPFVHRDVLVEMWEESENIEHFLSEEYSASSVMSSTLKASLAEIINSALVKMIFEDNYVHCDINENNVLVQNAKYFMENPPVKDKLIQVEVMDTIVIATEENKNPLRLVMCDVDVASHISNPEALANMFKGIILQDSNMCASAIEYFVSESAQKKDLSKFGKELRNCIAIYSKPTDLLPDLTLLIDQIFKVIYWNSIKMEDNFVAVLTSMLAVEAIGKKLVGDQQNLLEYVHKHFVHHSDSE